MGAMIPAHILKKPGTDIDEPIYAIKCLDGVIREMNGEDVKAIEHAGYEILYVGRLKTAFSVEKVDVYCVAPMEEDDEDER